jgi:hypothetical protein
MSQDRAETVPLPEPPAGEDRPAYSDAGVDLTLIRWMLSLTPAQRLEVLQQHIRSVLRLRHVNPHL